nr:hypothetical protein [uncultured Psychroserpens sp.]
MKNQKFYSGIIIMCCLSFFSVKCDNHDDFIEGEDGITQEQDAPVITVLKPNEDAVFYTDGGVDTPDYIIIEATATDESKIERGSVTIFNSSGVQVDYYEETSATQNGQSINAIYTSFRTFESGDYLLEYEFVDSAGNSSFETRNVTCLFSEIDGSEN